MPARTESIPSPHADIDADISPRQHYHINGEDYERIEDARAEAMRARLQVSATSHAMCDDLDDLLGFFRAERKNLERYDQLLAEAEAARRRWLEENV